MKKNKKIIALVLFVIAIGVAYIGYNESQSIGGALSSVVSGGTTDSVMLKYIAAAVLALAGIFMLKR